MKNYAEHPLPPENQRVKKIIGFYCKDNVLLFSKEIGISQPRLNRLFNIDKRNGIYPSPSFDIAQAILLKYRNIDADWLLTGQGQMFKLYQTPLTDNAVGISEDYQEYYASPSSLQGMGTSGSSSITSNDNEMLLQILNKELDLNTQLQTAITKKDHLIEELNTTIQKLLGSQANE